MNGQPLKNGSILIQDASVLRMKDVRRLLLKRGSRVSAVASFPHAEAVQIQADWTDAAKPFLQLQYIAQDGQEQCYRICIEAQRSNLGTGEVLYFRCPESGRRCRMLYMAYNFPRFKAREAYYIRLYYGTQLTGGRSRFNQRFWKAEQDLQRLQSGRQYLTHKGKPTRLAERIETLQERRADLDFLRWTAGVPAALQRLLF